MHSFTEVLSLLDSYVLLMYWTECYLLSVLVEENLVGQYYDFCNSYFSLEEEENARLLKG